MQQVLASSSASPTVAVENATSDGSPDWTEIIAICNSFNSNHKQAEEVVKAVEKRLKHKNPKVQFLSLMLLDMMVKIYGDSFHSQIGEKKILDTMIKIFKKKKHTLVGEKIFALLDSWQKAFGGNGGEHPQYYDAYKKIRRSGVEIPERYLDAAPTFRPPVTHPTSIIAEPAYGVLSNSARMPDEIIKTEIESLSLPSVDEMVIAMEVLSDFLHAWNPGDPRPDENEVIVRLVRSCRSCREKLMNEGLLCLCPELNKSLLSLLTEHDAIVSGASGASSSGASGASSSGADGASSSGASRAPAFVIGPQYCCPSTVELEISREAESTSNFVVRGAKGTVNFKFQQGKGIIPGGVLVGGDGNTVVHIKKQFPTLHGRWVVSKGKSYKESIPIFSVRRPRVTGKKTDVDVFLAGNKEEKDIDFRMEESGSENLTVIYLGESSTKVAEMHKKAVPEGDSTNKDIIVVKICSDIDKAFIVALVVIHEWIKEIVEKMKKHIRDAGKAAGKVTVLGGSHLLFELLKNLWS